MVVTVCWLLVIAKAAEPAARTPTTAKKIKNAGEGFLMVLKVCWLLVIANTAEPAARTPTTAKNLLLDFEGSDIPSLAFFFLPLLVFVR